VAREPVRGVPDRTSARAGPDRARRARRLISSGGGCAAAQWPS
jgi:hypothetical protein